MTYDHWKTTNPDDAYLGSAPQGGNPHEFQVKEILVRVPGKMIRQRMFAIFNRIGGRVADEFYPTADDADDAIGEMIADDDADRRLNRHRHEASEP